MNIKEFIDELVANGLGKIEAKKKIELAIKTIRENIGADAPDEVVEKYLRAFMKRQAAAKEQPYETGIIIGIGREFDKNKKIIAANLAAYDKNPAMAIEDGLVKLVTNEDTGNDELIVLDSREYLDNAKTMKNKFFGQELRPFKSRMAYAVINGEVVILSGSFECELGKEYAIHGKRGKNVQYFNVVRGGMRLIRDVPSDELWNIVLEAASQSPDAIELGSIYEVSDGKVILTHGFIARSGYTKNTQRPYVIVAEQGVDQQVFSFIDNDSTASALMAAGDNAEIILVGRKGSMPDGAPSLNIMGAIIESDICGDADDLFGELEIVFSE